LEKRKQNRSAEEGGRTPNSGVDSEELAPRWGPCWSAAVGRENLEGARSPGKIGGNMYFATGLNGLNWAGIGASAWWREKKDRQKGGMRISLGCQGHSEGESGNLIEELKEKKGCALPSNAQSERKL